MQLGMIGLGKVGTGWTRRLLSGGYKMVVFDRDPEAVAAAAANIAQRGMCPFLYRMVQPDRL